MNRLLFPTLLLAFTILAPAAPARPPNIVFIMADDLGWKDVGFMGADFFETPHIDRLAGEGMVFTAASSGGPNCSPGPATVQPGSASGISAPTSRASMRVPPMAGAARRVTFTVTRTSQGT